MVGIGLYQATEEDILSQPCQLFSLEAGRHHVLHVGAEIICIQYFRGYAV